ncbi:hypothetical protein FSP39_005153 [Pinctada imbricata]|uniref:Coiled-coil SMC6 And NSE5 INteracting (CANIN) domain-containing protein n=1 Tax=Pinctada imbricata TaxID=66713 RepID=A0AA88XZ36_PINIB|nr:hypothetical protein FSP39_005153 [Pinctada imbricata]
MWMRQNCFPNPNAPRSFVQFGRRSPLLQNPTWQQSQYANYNQNNTWNNIPYRPSSNHHDQRKNPGNFSNTKSGIGIKKTNSQEVTKNVPKQSEVPFTSKKEVTVDSHEMTNTGTANKSNLIVIKGVSPEKKFAGGKRPEDANAKRPLESKPVDQRPTSVTQHRAPTQAVIGGSQPNPPKRSNESFVASNCSYTRSQHETVKRSLLINEGSVSDASNSSHTSTSSTVSSTHVPTRISGHDHHQSRSSNLSDSIEGSSNSVEKQKNYAHEDLGLSTRLNISHTENSPIKGNKSQKSPRSSNKVSPAKGTSPSKPNPELGSGYFELASTLNTLRGGSEDSHSLDSSVLSSNASNTKESTTVSVVDNKQKSDFGSGYLGLASSLNNLRSNLHSNSQTAESLVSQKTSTSKESASESVVENTELIHGCFELAATLKTLKCKLQGSKDSQTGDSSVLPKATFLPEPDTKSIIDNKQKLEYKDGKFNLCAETNLGTKTNLGAKTNPVSTGGFQPGSSSRNPSDKPNSEGKEAKKTPPTFTKAPQTYKEYREAKQREEEERKREAKQKEEEERKKMEARRLAHLQQRKHRHHSYSHSSSHNKQREEFKQRSLSTELGNKGVKTGPFQAGTEKAHHIYQSSSYFSPGEPVAAEKSPSPVKQKLPFRSENSSFSLYSKKDPIRIKVEDEGKSEKSSHAAEQADKEAGKNETSASEMECSKDEELPGIVVQRRNSNKFVERTPSSSRKNSQESYRSDSQDSVLYRRESQGSGSHGGISSRRSSSDSQNASKNMDVCDRASEHGELQKEDGFRAINSNGDYDDDIRRYGSDLEVDMSDSDDDDLEAPDFLADLENAWRKPVPRTPPPKTHGSPVHSNSPVPLGQVSNPPKLPITKFSLDGLLSEEVDKTKEQLNLEKIQAKLEKDVRTGGFQLDLDEQKEKEGQPSGELLPEQKEHIQSLEVLDSVLRNTHPGEKIFATERYQSLFNSSFKPQECGFSPGKSYIDEHLASLQPVSYNDLFMSRLLMECLQSVSDQKAILSWIYLYMSTEESSLAVDGCFDVLEEYYYCEKHFNDREVPSWAPSVKDMLSALCNFGCEANFLIPKELVSASIFGSLHQQQNLPAVRNGTPGFQIENLRLVLVVLTYGLQSRAKYKKEELTALLVMLCRAALDERLSSELLTLELQCCIWAIVQKYSETDWESQSIMLCAILSAVTSHHHNAVYVCGLLPLLPRGIYLQRRVSFMFLLKIFGIEPTDIELFKLKSLHQFLPLMKDLVEDDMYKLSSCLNLLDKCIGNDTIKLSEKDDLVYIMNHIKKMSGEIRENVRVLDKSRLKDLMVRLTSKWTMLLLSCGSSQKTLFECTNGTSQKLKIETVQASQSDNDSEQSDQSEAELEDPLEGLESLQQ